MRAERRVAEAALEAAQAQLGRTEKERRKLADQLQALGDGSEQAARAIAEAEAKAASRALAKPKRAASKPNRAERAADRRDAVESALASARAALSAAKSEHDALARALEHGGGAAIASLKAEPGYERALAAALGEDFDAAIGGSDSPRRWQGSETQPDDPKLPDHCECLADRVSAPAELMRRLKQVAVVDEDAGQSLAVGQRLVTCGGRLRRWDGFVAEGSGAAAAERLLRANRLGALAAELPALETAVENARAERDAALAQMEQCRTVAEEARHAALAAERDARDAARAGDSAVAALERIEAQRDGLAQRQADLEPVIEAAKAAVAAAGRSLGALPDPAALEHDVETARSVAATTASAVAEKRAESATKARETAADRERLSAAAREQAEWRKRQSDAEQRLAGAVERQKQQSAERADLEKEPASLDEHIAALERANNESQVTIGDASAAERAGRRSPRSGRPASVVGERTFRRCARAPRRRCRPRRGAAGAQHRICPRFRREIRMCAAAASGEAQLRS